jgi:GDPmannose 4,6-dehydratase
MIAAFNEVGIELSFKGTGVNECAIVKACSNAEYTLPEGKQVVAVDPRYFRPTEVDLLIGDPSKANAKLGWNPKYDLNKLIHEMVHADVELFKRDKYLKEGGHKIFNYHE